MGRTPDAERALRQAAVALSGLAPDAPEVEELAYWSGEFLDALLRIMLRHEGEISAVVKDSHCTQLVEAVTRRPRKTFHRRGAS